ncbi:uncharacterized protein [Chironomus tepperi]|uniref:uncharacterized protein n=1 Tax=Chironomus tepperi TaxID=113505 RepID=UPI00391F9784
MGAIQSRSFDFYCNFAISHSIVEYIETESPSQVYHRLKDGCLTTSKQMEAVSIIIYDKVILKPHLSLKCAQLVKELEAEGCNENGELVLFHVVFAEYLLNIMKTFVSVYDDSKMNDFAVQRGKSIASFIGYLYIVDVFNLAPIIEICQMAKQKETQKNSFFIETIWFITSHKMKSENVSLEVFNHLIINGLTIAPSSDTDSDSEDDPMMKFSRFLDQICYDEHYEFYENFLDFKNMSEKALEVEITILVKDAIKVENKKFTNVYRDIALDIHYMRPNETRYCLSKLFIKEIERYEVIKCNDNAENLNRCSILGKSITKFYQSGLLDESVVEHYLNAVSYPNAASLLFTFNFIDVLTKYRGKNIYKYFDSFKKFASKLPNPDKVIAPVEEYVKDKEIEGIRNGKKIKRTGISAADLPDFRQFSSKCLTTKSTNNIHHPDIFVCENRPSCHFAALRGIELLNRHIGNNFFTPERIKICVNVTKKSLKFQIGEEIVDIFVREIKTYLPFFNGDIEPTAKVYNFSTLLAALYEEKLINHVVIDFWFEELFKSIKDKDHQFKDKILEIYSQIFHKVSLQFLRDHPLAWELNFSILEAFEFKRIKFDDFDKFREVCLIYKSDPKAKHLKKLQNVELPNSKFAIKIISRYMLKLYTDDNTDALEISFLITKLPEEFTPRLDKNILRSEFQEAICLKLGHLCAICKNTKSDGYTKAEYMIDLIQTLCLQTIVTRLGLANILNTISDLLNPNLYPVFELIKYYNEKVSQFFYGAKPLPTKVEKILLEVINKIKHAFEAERINYLKIKKVINVYENIIEDSKLKRKESEEKKQKQNNNDQKIQNLDNNKHLRDSSCSTTIFNENKAEQEPTLLQSAEQKSTKSKSTDLSSFNQPDTSILFPKEDTQTEKEDLSHNGQKFTANQPKVNPEDIKDYQDYCDYFNSIELKTSNDDKFLFDPIFISTIKFTKKEQINDLAKKFIERVLAGQSTVIFFIQKVQKIGNAIQNIFKLKIQKISFQKILVDEIFFKFENQKLLLEFMCELYNNSFVNKTSMIAFVDKFKSQAPENIVLMQIFVRTCAIRLSSQGDKEQLLQIRTIARSVKNLPNYDEDLKFLAQDLANSTNSIILLLENFQIKQQVLIESADKLVDDLLKNALKNPQIFVKSACNLDGKLKDLFIQKTENIIKEVPKFVIKPDEFMNLMEFVAELYNLEFLKNEFLTWTVEILMQSSTNDICSQSIELLFTKCGQKMENMNKHKFDIYMKFFEAVLAEENNTIRSECFKRILKTKIRKWKTLNIPQNFYEDFLMLFSMNDAKIDELVEIFKSDEEEMEKFIQILWKVILRDSPHPSYSILCEEISKYCENFQQNLTTFLTARCITFIGFNADMFNENVKERLGKVMTFVAEIYNNNLASDEILEMFLDQKLTLKLPSEFITRIFSILSKCRRFTESPNDRLKILVKNFDDIYYRGMDVQIESIIKGLNIINENVI